MEHILHIIDEIDINPDKSLVYNTLKILDVSQSDPWSRAPNNNHKILAHLLFYDKIPILITTNFDRLIENAYESLFAEALDRSRIIKLHGDIKDPSSILAILPKVVTPIQGSPREHLKKILSEYSLCIVGYSGSDLDISPVFREVNSNSEFYWLVHPDTESIEKVSHLAKMLQGKRAHIIPYDLNAFFDKIAALTNCQMTENDNDNVRPDYTKYWIDWSNALSTWQKRFIVGCLYQELAVRESELIYYNKSRRAASSMQEQVLSLYRIGTAHLGLGHFLRAFCFLRFALSKSKTDKNLSMLRASIFRDMGDVFYRIGRRKNYLPLIQQGLFFIARRYFFLAKQVVEENTRLDILQIADYEILATYGLILSHIGKVYRELGEYDEALRIFGETISLASRDQNSNYWLQAEALVHRAATNLRKNSIRDAENDVNEAFQKFEVLGNQEGIEYAKKILQEIKKR